jgi:hypothetical protein
MGKPPPNFTGWPCDKAGYHLQSKTAQVPQSEFVGVLLHDKPSLSFDEAVAVGRAMLQVADHMRNLQCTTSKNEMKRITVKDIAAPAKVGDPNPPLANMSFDMFDSSIADIAIPSFGEPGDRPYLGGFDLSAMDVVLREVLPTVQDMSTLVLDNAQFYGEASDDQDRQWYTQLPVQDHIISSNATASSSSHIAPIARAEFENFSSHSRNLDRESNNNPIETAIQPTAASEFAAFSSRSRNLGRMTSEQALDFFLDQHRSRSSQ